MMPSETREQLLRRLEAAHANRNGVRLSWEELDLLMARPQPCESAADIAARSSRSTSGNYCIRWFIRRDMQEVLDIEQAANTRPLSEDDLLAWLRQRNCIGMVAEDSRSHRILGYMVYELQKSSLVLLSFAVHSDAQRQGVGTAMIDWLIDKLSQQRRKHIRVGVRESNTNAQLFFAAMGFKALHVERDAFVDEDGYAMQYTLRETARNTDV